MARRVTSRERETKEAARSPVESVKSPKSRSTNEKRVVAINEENGMYVSGSLLTSKLEWLVNTGCNVTILSADVFNSLAVQERPKLKQIWQELNASASTSSGSDGRS